MAGSAVDRDSTIDAICAEFVNPSKANREIYRYIIEALWPPGRDLPGPILTNAELRAAVNAARRAAGKTQDYQDPFRRVRELQGEEGLLGLEKRGLSYQLVHVEVSEKRIPRVTVSDTDWEAIRARSDYACAVCRAREEDGVLLVPDHKVPRLRLNDVGLSHIDGDARENLQALCVQCNTFKSVACRGCQAYCLECPWGNPEENPSVTLRGPQLRWVADMAWRERIKPQVFLERIISHAQEDSKYDTEGGLES